MTDNPADIDHPTDGYVILVTYGRSGSTLLQKVLNSIDGYCIRGENGGMVAHLARAALLAYSSKDFVRRRTALRDPDAPGLDTWRRDLGTPDDPWFGAERVDPDRLARGLIDVFVREVLQPGPGTQVAGFKDIRFHNDPALFALQLDMLRAFLPGTRFVFLTRRHDDVMRSGWHIHQNRFWLRRELRRADRLFADYAARHPDVCFSVRYEDISAAVDNFRPLFDFLKVPFDAERIAAVTEKRLGHLQRQPLSTRQRLHFAILRTLRIVPAFQGRFWKRKQESIALRLPEKVD